MSKFIPAFLRTKSVLSPSAQTIKLCKVVNDRDKVKESLKSVMDKIPDYKSDLRAIVELQYRYGLRISEVLRINIYKVSVDGRIIIKGSKGSSDRIVYAFNSVEYFNNCLQKNINPFDHMNRYHIYREYKKYGFIYKKKGGLKLAVTHSFRHRVIESLRENGVDEKVTAQFIGHKNSKNTGKYGNNSERVGES